MSLGTYERAGKKEEELFDFLGAHDLDGRRPYEERPGPRCHDPDDRRRRSRR